MKLLAAYTICLVLLFALIASVINQNIEADAWKDSARIAAERSTILKAELAEAKLDVRRDTVRVTRWATRYDTVRAAVESILVAADSGDSSAVPFPIFADAIQAADSTIAACRQLVTSSGIALTTCDSVVASVGRERDAWRKVADARKPSKWGRMKPWLFGAAGFYVGANVRVR